MKYALTLISLCYHLGSLAGFPDASFFIPSHGIYLSLIEINHQSPEQNPQITLRVFCDDLENALYNFHQKPIPPNQLNHTHLAVISTYFEQHFRVHINQDRQSLQLISCKKEGTVYWLVFNINNTMNWSHIEVKANFFMELFPAQNNILTILHQKQQYHFRMTPSNDRIQLNLNTD